MRDLRSNHSTSVFLASLALLFFVFTNVLPSRDESQIVDEFGTTADTCGTSDAFALRPYRWMSTPIRVFFDSSIPPHLLEAVKEGIVPWELEEHPEGKLAAAVSNPPVNGVTVEFGPIDGPDGALAQTALTVTVRTLAVQRVVVRFDVEENWVLRPPTCRANRAGGIAIQDISTHEFGHALVTLGHVYGGDGRWLTMNPVHWGSERTLARGDKLGIRARYNATPDVVEEPTSSSGGGSEIIVEFSALGPPSPSDVPRNEGGDAIANASSGVLRRRH